MSLKTFCFLSVALVVFVGGCASTKVERVDVGEKIDLSGDWNDYDAALVSLEMVKDCLSGKWLEDYDKFRYGTNYLLSISYKL